MPDIKDITNAITYAEILLLKLYIASLLVNSIWKLWGRENNFETKQKRKPK